MSPALSRCDQEISRILAIPQDTPDRAYLCVMGLYDWQAEKRLILLQMAFAMDRAAVPQAGEPVGVSVGVARKTRRRRRRRVTERRADGERVTL